MPDGKSNKISMKSREKGKDSVSLDRFEKNVVLLAVQA